jgi:GPH family glycoside/pentoside/hexuronide:cation symporter
LVQHVEEKRAGFDSSGARWRERHGQERNDVTTSDTARLTLRQKLGYGVGDLGQTLFFQVVLLYLIYFYTDVAGIAPAAVATILVIARMIDASANPVIGVIADRTRTRWGRFRPYLLFGAAPLAIMAFATFTAVPGSPLVKQVYAIASYALFSICFAAVAIPYSALLATITTDPAERTTLGTLRAGFSFSAGIVVSLVTLPLVTFAGGGGFGFHVAIGLFGVLGVALLWTAFANTRESAPPPRHEAPNIRESLRCIGTAPMMLIVGVFLLSNISTMLRSAGAIYYFKYTLGRAELVSAYLTFGAVMTVVGIAATPLIARLIGKRGAMILGLALMAVGYIMTSILPPSLVSTFIWLGFFPYFGFGLKAATTWAILADCVDFAEWKLGKRVEGVAYGFAIFAQKLSLAVGGAVAGWTLAATGYVANAQQGPAATRGILALVGYFPALCLIVAVVLGLLYPLTAARIEEINADLRARKAAEPAEVV